MKHKVLISISILLLLIGCGGGGGSDSPDLGTAPRIDGVTLYRVEGETRTQTNEFWEGDLSSFDLYAHDPDLDIASMVTVFYYPYDSETPYSQDTFPLPSQTNEDTLYQPIDPIEPDLSDPTGDWRVDFYLVDAKGNESNTFSVQYVVNAAE